MLRTEDMQTYRSSIVVSSIGWRPHSHGIKVSRNTSSIHAGIRIGEHCWIKARRPSSICWGVGIRVWGVTSWLTIRIRCRGS